MISIRIGLAPALVALMALTSGCGSQPLAAPAADRAANANRIALEQVAQMVQVRNTDAGGKTPAKLADFAKYQNLCPTGFGKMKSGDIVFLYGAPIQEGASDVILAYEKPTPESGGLVLMQDGTTIESMTADGFKSARKAGTTASADSTSARSR